MPFWIPAPAAKKIGDTDVSKYPSVVDRLGRMTDAGIVFLQTVVSFIILFLLTRLLGKKIFPSWMTMTGSPAMALRNFRFFNASQDTPSVKIGQIIYENLRVMDLDGKWLVEALRKRNIANASQVCLATVNKQDIDSIISCFYYD